MGDHDVYDDLIQNAAKAVPTSKCMRDAWASFSPGLQRTGDISLATYLMQHVLTGDAKGIASIGRGSDPEFFLLNALADPGSNFIYLNTEQSAQARRHLGGMTNHIEAAGFPQRTIVSDLTLPSRWPGLLKALAAGDIRILGVDAAWAPQDAHFWSNLAAFLADGQCVAFVRGLLDYRRPLVTTALLHAMPDGCPVEVIAATPGAVWFASAAAAAALRAALAGSHLFGSDMPVSAQGVPAPACAQDESAMDLLNDSGLLPLAALRIGRGGGEAMDFISGWSSVEPDGCWTQGEEATVSIQLPHGDGAATTLVIEGNPWLSPVENRQVVEFGLGPFPSEWQEVEFGEDGIRHITLPVSGARFDRTHLEVVLRVRHSGRPSDHGGSDSRILGFKARSFRVYA